MVGIEQETRQGHATFVHRARLQQLHRSLEQAAAPLVLY